MTKKNLLFLFPMIIVASLSFQCQKEISGKGSVERPMVTNTANAAPVALAGPNQEIVLPINTVSLDGSSSNDADSNIISYYWINISGPSIPQIANANAVQTQASALVEGVYKFELKVTDAAGLFSNDTVQVTVVSRKDACDIDSRPVVQARLVPLGKLSIGKVGMVTASANNKILFASGTSYNKDSTGIPLRRIDIYDISSNSWSTKDLDKYPTWRADIGIADANNKIFMAGGGFWGDDIYTNRVDIYDASDNTWSITSLSEYRSASTGVSAGNKVFFAGGLSFGNGGEYWSNTVDIYDNATNTWSTGSLSEGRGYVSAVAAGNKVYFAGGQKNNGQLLASDRIDEYDLLANSWSVSALQGPRCGIAAIAVGNIVFFAGGLESTNNFSGTVEIRDIATGAKSFACIIPRSNFSAVLKDDDKIIFFTGYGSDPRNGDHFEIYDLTSHTWSTGILDKNIKGAAIISVNNVIYVAGGFVNGVGSDQVWILEF